MARRKAAEAEVEGKLDLPQEPQGHDQVLERVKALEATVSALIFSTFGARDSGGKMLIRCRCGCFATRHVQVNHKVAGNQVEYLCDECSVWSPLAAQAVIEERPLLDPADMSNIVRVNRNLVQARAWGSV